MVWTGSGVNATNVAAIIEATGVHEVHMGSGVVEEVPSPFTLNSVTGERYIRKRVSVEKVRIRLVIFFCRLFILFLSSPLAKVEESIEFHS